MIQPIEKPARMVEVAPNRFVQMDLTFEVPEMVVADMIPIPGQPGAFRCVPRNWEKLERVTIHLCEKLGLGKSTMTLRRLIRAGFVHGAPVAPKVYNVDITSFYDHMTRCAENPDLWRDPKLLKQYMETY